MTFQVAFTQLQPILPKRTERTKIISQERHSTRVFSLTKRCGNCGAENREVANYCLKCGQSMLSPPIELIAVAPAPASPPAVWRPPLVRGCLFHPTLPANFNCAGCGAPMCLACAGCHYGAMFCPICYSRHIGTWVPKMHLTYFDPFAPRLVYGVRSARWFAPMWPIQSFFVSSASWSRRPR